MTSVRDATSDDAAALVPLLATLGYPTTADAIRERLPRVLAAGDRVLVAAGGDGRILGFVTIHVTPSLHRARFVGRVTAIAVSEQSHGQGVGRALMAAAERIVREAGCERLEVTSSHAHATAHAFYRALGYADDGVRFAKRL